MLDLVHYTTGGPLEGRLAEVLGRRGAIPADIERTAAAIVAAVRDRGDEAVAEYTVRFDGVRLTPGRFRVPQKALHDALNAADPALMGAIERAAANIRSFHEAQKADTWFRDDGDGVVLGRRITPLRRVGICVPGGEAPLISSLLMAAVPAQVAGVDEICVVTPPLPSGLPHPGLLAAAGFLGLDEVYAIGGAQAVAALAHGTGTVPAVDKIVGPGGPYTVAAKRQVYGLVGIEMVPGPSEIAVLADDTASPAFIAADLLSQAEHGSGFEAALCITPSADLARAVRDEVERQKAALPRLDAVDRALSRYGVVVVVPDLETGVELVDRLAPEHLELLVAEPWEWLERVRNAGAVFLGEASTEPVGDYYAGTNHVLPTNGAARFSSSLGLSDFVKATSVVAYTPERLRAAAADVTRLARAEGFEAHARAVEVRLQAWSRGGSP